MKLSGHLPRNRKQVLLFKLTGAARRLKESDAKVIDVALDSGFESVDGFQRAFYREFGCNPGTYGDF